MVAARRAWVRAARPDLTVDQVAQVVRLSARDIGAQGLRHRRPASALLDVGAALASAAAAARPARAQRRHRVRRRPRVRQRRAARSSSGRGRHGCAALLDASRTRPTSTASACRRRSRVRDRRQPVVRRPGPRRSSRARRATAARAARGLARRDLAPHGRAHRAVRAAQPRPRGRATALRRASAHRPRRPRARRGLPAHDAAAASGAGRRPLRLGEVAGALERLRASAPRGCRAGTTRRRARPDSPSRRR